MISWIRGARWLLRVSGLCLATALASMTALPYPALAQAPDDPWDVPVNLSHSGAATNPTLFADSRSVLHAIWQDEFADYVVAHLAESSWSTPVTTDLDLLFGPPGSEPGDDEGPPFTGPNPLFITGDRPFVHAFWVTPEGKLYTSRAQSVDFARFAAWTRRKLISDSAASFAAAFDAQGVLHLAYVRTANGTGKPAGLYHTRLNRFGADWAVPALVAGSPYYRGLSGGEANLSLATAGTAEAPLVYIAWDNWNRKQVLLVKSANGGADWEQPLQVAGPMPGSGQARPYNIRVGASEQGAMVLWQTGAAGGPCTQSYRFSGDAGATWSEAQVMFADQTGCAESNSFVAGQTPPPGGLLYLLTDIKSQTILTAWDGKRWSMPQEQRELAGFEETEIFTDVVFECHQAVWFGERLYVVGCDTGQGGDIWVTSREVKAAATWFVEPVWSQPLPISSERFAMTDLESAATGDGFVHTFLSQALDTAVYYSRWDGARWSRITPVLELPDGEARWPAIAAGPGDKLFLVTSSSSGALYYSRSTSRNALTAAGWSAPKRLPTIQDAKASPADVVWDATGTITIAYSVPVNENRGVYLVRSRDEGQTWSEPIQAFDGVAAGFELVGSPTMAVASDGSLHVMWKQQDVDTEGLSPPLALYYVRAAGNELDISAAELVAEGNVAWRELVVDSRGQVHRLWQHADSKATLWDQVSQDGGQTWQTAQRLSAEAGGVAILADDAGQLHLVSAGTQSLSHWLWDGSRWRAQAALRWLLAAQRDGLVVHVSAAVDMDGELIVSLSVPTGAADSTQEQLVFATSPLGNAVTQSVVPDDNRQVLFTRGLDSKALQQPQDLAQEAAHGSGATAPGDAVNRLEAGVSAPAAVQSGQAFVLVPLSVTGVLVWRARREKAKRSVNQPAGQDQA